MSVWRYRPDLTCCTSIFIISLVTSVAHILCIAILYQNCCTILQCSEVCILLRNLWWGWLYVIMMLSVFLKWYIQYKKMWKKLQCTWKGIYCEWKFFLAENNHRHCSVSYIGFSYTCDMWTNGVSTKECYTVVIATYELMVWYCRRASKHVRQVRHM